MFRFLLGRLLATIPVLLVVAIAVFLILRLTPGDPAAVIAGDSATTEQIERIRAGLGLDQPIPTQFAIWAGNALRGDLGESFFFKKQVSELIGQRIEPTLALALCTIVLAVSIAVPLGVLAAWRHGGWLDRALMGFSTLGFSIPVFVLGYLLIWLVSMHLGWLPVQGYRRLAEGLGPFIRHLILPSVTLSIVYVALIARVTRAAVSEALTEDYVRTARAKGLSERAVLLRHVLRNALIPILTNVSMQLPGIFVGSFLIEVFFSIPGLGREVMLAVNRSDYPVIQAVTIYLAVITMVINLLTDLLYKAVDPRVTLK